MAPVVIFHGPPNAGKSSQARLLAARRGSVFLSSGDELRNSGDPEIINRLMEGKLAKSADVLRIMRHAIEKVPADQSIVLDGFPRMIGEFKQIEAWFAELGRPISQVVEISLPEAESYARSGKRGRHDDHNTDQRLHYYRTETQQVLDYNAVQGRLVVVDGLGTPDEVRQRVEAAL